MKREKGAEGDKRRAKHVVIHMASRESLLHIENDGNTPKKTKPIGLRPMLLLPVLGQALVPPALCLEI